MVLQHSPIGEGAKKELQITPLGGHHLMICPPCAFVPHTEKYSKFQKEKNVLKESPERLTQVSGAGTANLATNFCDRESQSSYPFKPWLSCVWRLTSRP